MTIEVMKPGLQTTVQDLGRWGHQAIGIPVCGAMDDVSHRLANLVAGNEPHAASLEITLLGPRLRFRRDAWICIAGADLTPTMSLEDGSAGAPVPMYRAHRMPAGTLLSFGARRHGMRAYLAVAGGFDGELAFGSRSTHLRTAMGGIDGRALRAGDVLRTLGERAAEPPLVPVPRALCFAGTEPLPTVHVTAGREHEQFDADALRALEQASFTITTQSDRMAYRLSGPTLSRKPACGDILSEAVAFGTVQVPPSGQPIVLMADRQTSGGYPRIAQVAAVALPLLAQLIPGTSLRFKRVSLDVAQDWLLQRERALADVERRLAHLRATRGAS